jgi:predicted nucleotidyltransferase
MSLALAQPQLDAIAEACRRHQVLRMHLFGSALREDFGLEQQLAAITGNPVDLVMADAMRNPYVRRDIEASKQPPLSAKKSARFDPSTWGPNRRPCNRPMTPLFGKPSACG